MAIISNIGRRAPRTRFIIGTIYFLLTIGSLTMIYPFLLMMSGSTKSAIDTPEARVIPSYLVDDTALYRKHVEGMFNESTDVFQNSYGAYASSFRHLKPPKEDALLGEWDAFLQSDPLPVEAWALGYMNCPVTRSCEPFNFRLMQKEFMREYGSLAALNLRLGSSFAQAREMNKRQSTFLSRFTTAPETPFLKRMQEFQTAQPTKWRSTISLTNLFRSMLQATYGRDVSEMNAALGTSYGKWAEVPVGSRIGEGDPALAADFETFLRQIVNPVWLRIDPSAQSDFTQFLRQRYDDNIAALNAQYGTSWSNFDAILLPSALPAAGMPATDWRSFIEGWRSETGETLRAPSQSLSLTGPDFQFREFLRARYASVDAVEAATGARLASWETVAMPVQAAQYRDFLEMRNWLRWEFTVRNYISVWNYIVVNGRGLVNTVIFCALAVLAALTVDPIAAYALSRFRPKSSFQILLLLMLTMAFPAMVTQIPTFLLLRDLGMLNTFWALVLPGIANGYHIFLLKGFFDSLPKELYESAEIDGASEATIFFQITLALSKPILAVIALGAFTSAYAAFMFALLLCQDPRMWTLMVWLYQLQSNSAQGIVFASLLIAAIPTFVVFLTCQNVIMRGIVVPVEK